MYGIFVKTVTLHLYDPLYIITVQKKIAIAKVTEMPKR